MQRAMVLMGSLVILVCIASADARGGPAYIPNVHTTPLLNDYFDPDPRIRELVNNVEVNHLYRNRNLSYEPGYSIKNIIAEGTYTVAMKELKYVLDRICNHPKALELMADLAKITGDPTLGIFYYKRAVNLYPQYAVTHFRFGSFLLDVGSDEDGIEELERAVEIDPTLAEAHAILSVAYEKAGKTVLARKAGDEAKRLGYNGNVPDNVATPENPGAGK
jgi:predicted Zn-dependent protease